MSFAATANSLTGYYQTEVETGQTLTSIYENQEKASPDEGKWADVFIQWGSSAQIEIGILRYRTNGIFTVELHNDISLGVGDLLELADIIAAKFRGTVIDAVHMEVPRIVNVGRVGKSYQVNVLCPFYFDHS